VTAPARRGRLDRELVRRTLVQSREEAVTLIREGRVRVEGLVTPKPASQVGLGTSVTIAFDSATPRYASRGGVKLAGALEEFTSNGLNVTGRRCLDAGASTGGFTDVLLRKGCREIIAVDVGYGQLAWHLRTDSRVRVLDRTNVRELAADTVGGPVDVVVADLSFISLTMVLDAFRRCIHEDSDLMLLVKPQFEVGRGAVGRGGVVRDPELRAAAIRNVVQAADHRGLVAQAVTASSLPGPAGNVEYFVWFRPRSSGALNLDIEKEIRRAITTGPK
jgi:23S rRNA (cytidine1920-2'-O)/16S rRNA (cytidine1409-2'-O)-methyltransferase